MSEWQQSSERAVLVDIREERLLWKRRGGAADSIAAEWQAEADAITAALALADRAAELEAALAEERAVVAELRDDRICSIAHELWRAEDIEDDRDMRHFKPEAARMVDAQIEQARAAHRNAAQQEGQGDGE